MRLICEQDYSYGNMPRIPSKQAKELDLDPKLFTGGAIKLFQKGEVYDVETNLARRLLRDYGPKRGRTNVKFRPEDPMDMIDLLTGEADKITLRDALDRGFVTPEGAEKEQTVEVGV